MTTILLVEDEAELAQVIVEELEKRSYHVLHASDGLTALDLHQQHRPDLVILDWVIPILSGLEVLRRLRQVALTPVLMLSAHCEVGDRVIALELGADDYLTKPFSLAELQARVRALLRRVERVREIVRLDREARTPSLACQGLALDPDQRQVTVDGRPVELTPPEFDLLYLLLRNPGRVFSRAYLQETVWNEVYRQGDRTVDDAVVGLRQKLGGMAGAIETVLGAGYRLSPG